MQNQFSDPEWVLSWFLLFKQEAPISISRSSSRDLFFTLDSRGSYRVQREKWILGLARLKNYKNGAEIYEVAFGKTQ